VFASFIGIIAGLGLTLLCLAIYRRALPALPFSIALGVLFFFTTMLVTEQYVTPMVTHLTFY
jgi:presenilin 1